MANRRAATYVGTLVYMNEPQLILLKSHKTHIVALAVPDHPEKAMFIATSVSQKNWQDYLDGMVDLRYLFTYAEHRSTYHFDLMKMKNKKLRWILGLITYQATTCQSRNSFRAVILKTI